MANEEKNIQESASKPTKKKKPNFFSRTGKRISKWFREMKSELKKVVWPTRKQTINNTGVALVVMMGSAIILWAFDKIASLGVQALISILR